MNKLIVLVGLPGCGKSTYANKLANEIGDTIVLSSDSLRKELLGDESCQENNTLVFDALYSRAKQYLLEGKNVIIDATNINIKDRRRTLSHFIGMKIKRIAIVIATPIEICYQRDKNRDRTVGEIVINKFLHRFEIPMEYEGFDDIQIIKSEYCVDNLNEIKYKMDITDQLNPHHQYMIGVHCNKCVMELQKYTSDCELLYAAQWHDIGKMFTRTIDEEGIAHYYGHHNVGSYIILSELSKNIPINAIFYINFHMNPFFWKEQKTHEKYKKLFGERLYNNLILLNKCDKIASGTQRGDENV